MVDLREDFTRGTAPHKVDRDKGTIYDVKILGRTSVNSHGVEDVTGTDYALSALESALPRYEGLAVNVDHPDRDNPGKDRSSYDRFGKLADVRIVPEDGYRGNLVFLKSHPMAERICEAAERMPECFALSHNARGKGEVRNGRYVILEIPEVRSVDVVADGGTNRSLFESHRKPAMSTKRVKLKTLCEAKAVPAPIKARLRKLLEDYAETGDMEVEAPEEEAGDWKQSLIDAIGQLVDSGDEEAHAMARKILGMLKPAAAATETEESDEGDEESSEVEESEEEGDEGDDKPKDAKESRRPKSRAGYRQLKERLDRAELKEFIRDECDARELACPTELLESLLAMSEKKAIGKHLDYIKGLKVRPAAQKPRSQAPGGTRPVRESAGGDSNGGAAESITGFIGAFN